MFLRSENEGEEQLKVKKTSLHGGISRTAAEGGANIADLADSLKAWRFRVTGTQGWDAAQVTGGGIPLDEVDPDTMESRLQPGLYLAGELLDVTGDCGGFNLHWAWCSGIRAGRSAGTRCRR